LRYYSVRRLSCKVKACLFEELEAIANEEVILPHFISVKRNKPKVKIDFNTNQKVALHQ
jgi:hypothetical protein